jgi:hypothetical protein
MAAKTPPAAFIAGLNRLRGALDRLYRSTAPSHIAMLELALGSWFTAALYGAVRLGIADALADGPLTAEDVARRVDTHPEATHRLMCTLASRGVLKLRRDGRFQLTRLGQALRSDHPESMAPMIRFVGSPQHWEHWGHLIHSVRTGRTAVGHLRGLETFDYLETDPEFAAIFDAAMTGSSRAVIENAVPAYDFSDAKLIVDVGGGQGGLLSAVLGRAPQAVGVLFDRPSVVASADSVLRPAGVADRCTVTGGDFFEAVPDGGDVYLLKAIVHDWDDDQAVRILRNVRTAIADGGRVLLWEMVLPEGAPHHLGFMIDLEMLVSAGGRERTASQYRRLLADAGFRMTKVVPTASPLSIVEAVPA